MEHITVEHGTYHRLALNISQVVIKSIIIVTNFGLFYHDDYLMIVRYSVSHLHRYCHSVPLVRHRHSAISLTLISSITDYSVIAQLCILHVHCTVQVIIFVLRRALRERRMSRAHIQLNKISENGRSRVHIPNNIVLRNLRPMTFFQLKKDRLRTVVHLRQMYVFCRKNPISLEVPNETDVLRRHECRKPFPSP